MLAVLVGAWLVVTLAIVFLGVTPTDPPCLVHGTIGSPPMDPQAIEAYCARFQATTRAEWEASLTVLQRLTQPPLVVALWVGLPLLAVSVFAWLLRPATGSRRTDALSNEA
jgi:hypothetical protein